MTLRTLFLKPNPPRLGPLGLLLAGLAGALMSYRTFLEIQDYDQVIATVTTVTPFTTLGPVFLLSMILTGLLMAWVWPRPGWGHVAFVAGMMIARFLVTRTNPDALLVFLGCVMVAIIYLGTFLIIDLHHLEHDPPGPLTT